MRTFDLTPLFRTSVGFDRMDQLLNAAMQLENKTTSYPPYNIARAGEDAYCITLAVAGFGEDNLDITVQESRLTVTGKHDDESDAVEYLHRGIAGRAFERRFQLADHIKVTGARMDNGLLHIDLMREIPEALKPRTIAIQAGETKELSAAK